MAEVVTARIFGDVEYGDGCVDCGGTGAVYQHAPSCRDDHCVGNGDEHDCIRGTWVPCPSCGAYMETGMLVRISR